MDNRAVELHRELQQYIKSGLMPNDNAAGMPGTALSAINSLQELVKKHSNVVCSYIVGLNIITDVLVFLKSRHVTLATAAVRFISAVVNQHNADYARYLVKWHVIEAVVSGWWQRDGDLDAQLMAAVHDFNASVDAVGGVGAGIWAMAQINFCPPLQDTSIPAAKKTLGL